MFIRCISTVGCRLIEYTSGLQFDILTICIRQQIFPDATFACLSPQEDLHTQLLVKLCMMDRTIIFAMPIDTIIIIIISQYMIRLRVAKIVFLVPADVPAFFVDRESKQLTAVADLMIARIAEFRVLAYRIARIHPMIIRLIDRGLIVPRRMRREVSLVFRQIHFHRPGCTGKPFIRKDITAHTAVIFFLYQIINRCTGSRRMTNDTEVKFDTTRCPRTTHRYITEFGHAIVINKRLAGCLVDCAPYLSSDFGEQGNLDIIVFQLDCFPFFIHSFSRKTIKTEIRIIHIGR